jgi:acyl-ACP thioesterase
VRDIHRIWSVIRRTACDLRFVNCVPSQIQCNYIFQFQGQRSNRTYFRCYWVYVDNSMRVILRIWSVIRRTACDLRFVNCVPSQIQCNYIFQFQGQRSNRTYFRYYWVYVDNSMRVILRIWSVIRRTSCDLRFVNCVPSQIQCNYIFQFSRSKI